MIENIGTAIEVYMCGNERILLASPQSCIIYYTHKIKILSQNDNSEKTYLILEGIGLFLPLVGLSALLLTLLYRSVHSLSSVRLAILLLSLFLLLDVEIVVGLRGFLLLLFLIWDHGHFLLGGGVARLRANGGELVLLVAQTGSVADRALRTRPLLLDQCL